MVELPNTGEKASEGQSFFRDPADQRDTRRDGSFTARTGLCYSIPGSIKRRIPRRLSAGHCTAVMFLLAQAVQIPPHRATEGKVWDSKKTF
jgi:hypothetical protein